MNSARPATLVIATHNAHKVTEIRAILGGGISCLTLNDFPGAPEVVEDANSFAGNATKKAVTLAKWISDQPSNPILSTISLVLADDSGLEVDALGGAPGIQSARFAALDSGKPGNSSTADNNAKLLRLLTNVPMEQRKARFRCVIAMTPVLRDRIESASPVCYADEFEMQTQCCEGTCEGRIQSMPSGLGGFGYDPLFIPEGFKQSFAELGEETKNQISHRAKALQKLKRLLNQNS